MKKKNLKIIKALVELNGEEEALKKLGEEAQELALAITQYFCPTKTNKKKRIEDVHKELGDIKNAMRGAEMTKFINSRKVNRYANKKLKQKQIKYLT